MEQNLSHRRERGSLAPFVGVALAALTVGSLVLFSVVAQRTSLEGFSARGIAVAPAPPRETTGSITLPAAPETGAAEGDSEGTGADETTEPDASELLFVTDDEPTVATTAAVQGDAGSDPEADVSLADGVDANVMAAPDADALAPFFRMAAGGPDNGEVEPTTDARKAKGRDRDEKTEKDKKAKKAKKAKASKRSGHGNRGRSSRSASSSRPSKPDASSRSARSSRSSRPAQASRSSAAKSRPASNHQNRRGNGHSKGRGKGHRH